MKFHNYIIVLMLFSVFSFSQKTLRITYNKLGHTKIVELYTNTILEYKLKEERHYRKDRIVNLQDSLIIFQNDFAVKFNELKTIRFRGTSHLSGTFQALFMMGGVGFITLNTINNLIIHTSPIITTSAVYVSAALIATSLLIKQIRTKTIRITRKTDFKLIELDFQNLNKKDP